MPIFTATVNVPGYLPMADQPAVFDSAKEAWEYLLEHRKEDEDASAEANEDAVPQGYSDTVTELEKQVRVIERGLICDFEGVGSVHGPSTIEMMHDLGLTYSVTEIPFSEIVGYDVKVDIHNVHLKRRAVVDYVAADRDEVHDFIAKAKHAGYEVVSIKAFRRDA